MNNQTNYNKNYIIYDNQGASIDRYTVIKKDSKFRIQQGMPYHSALALSSSPLSPTGVCMHVEVVIGAHLGKVISFKKLPADCQSILTTSEAQSQACAARTKHLDNQIWGK